MSAKFKEIDDQFVVLPHDMQLIAKALQMNDKAMNMVGQFVGFTYLDPRIVTSDGDERCYFETCPIAMEKIHEFVRLFLPEMYATISKVCEENPDNFPVGSEKRKICQQMVFELPPNLINNFIRNRESGPCYYLCSGLVRSVADPLMFYSWMFLEGKIF